MNKDVAEKRDFRTYLQPVLKRWWLILAVVPVVTIGSYLYYANKPKVYEASAELFVQPSPLNEVLIGTTTFSGPGTIENLALLLQTPSVSQKAEKILASHKGKVPIGGGVSAERIGESSFISVRAVAPTPVGASLLANAYSKAFIRSQSQQFSNEADEAIQAAEKQLAETPSIGESQERHETLESKIQTLQLIASSQSGGSVRQVQSASPSATPINHDPKSNAIFAFVISLLLSVGACFGLEYLTRRVSSIEDVEEIYELPVLTEVPKVDGPAPRSEHGMEMDKALHQPFQRLQMNLDMLSKQRPLRTILIASAAPGEGKSVVARNLALAYREAGNHVAVLDADFRKAALGDLLDAKQGPGLADILAGRATFGQAVQEVDVHIPDDELHADGVATNGSVVASSGNGFAGRVASPTHGPDGGELALVPAGRHSEQISTALSSAKMRETLRTAADTYGTAIIDSPPILAVADVLPLLSEADGVLIVTRLGVSTRESAKRMMAELNRISNVNILGVVVNGIPPRTYRTRAYGYYYG